MSETDDTQMNWVEYAEAFGDEALRRYVDEQPDELRRQLLNAPEVAEIYNRGSSPEETARSGESEGDASPSWEPPDPGLAPPPLGDTQMDPIVYAREHGDQALVEYVDSQPDELRHALLEQEDVAEIYHRTRQQ